MDKNTFCLLYKALVRPHVEYAHSVWCPYKNVILLILRKFKKEPSIINSLKNCSYKERLKILNLPTLKYRRLRGDMIDVFKIAITCMMHHLYLCCLFISHILQEEIVLS